MLGQGVWRSPVRFPTPTSHFVGPRGNELLLIYTYVGAGLWTFSGRVGGERGACWPVRVSFLHEIWDVLRCVWEWPGHVFGWLRDGSETHD